MASDVRGYLSRLTKTVELEEQKQDLDRRLAYERTIRPLLTKDQIVFWLERFRGGDVNDPGYREQLVATFVSGVRIDADRLVITYNYSGHGGRPHCTEKTIGPEYAGGGVRIPPDWWS